MTTEFFTRPKHDFTRLGRVDGWLGRTLTPYHLINFEDRFGLRASVIFLILKYVWLLVNLDTG